MVLAIQDLCDLLPTLLLVLRVKGQVVEEELEAAGCAVVAPDHERAHFCVYVLVGQRLLILILKGRKHQRASLNEPPVYPGSNSLRFPISSRGNTSPGHSLVDSDYSQ